VTTLLTTVWIICVQTIKNQGEYMNTFYNQMFNPQYVNSEYYHKMEQQQNKADQDKEIAKAVKAIRDLCEAVKQLDNEHQQIAFSACLAEMAKEFNWQ
jgi:hemoglobin-like flavoprotein